MKHLPYLDAVVQEGLRYQAIGPIAGIRFVAQEVELGGYRIPPGTMIGQAYQVLAHDRSLFPHPDRFEPDNFFGRKVRQQDWLPFGGGTRSCAGMVLAQVEMAVVTATLLRDWDLELDGSSRRRPRRSGPVTFQPEDGLRVRLLGRFD